MLAAALAPLSLYLLATDYYRWWSVAITNLFIVFAYLAVRGHDETSLADAVERSPVIVACILGVSLVFGPLGGGGYPLIDLWFLPCWNWDFLICH